MWATAPGGGIQLSMLPIPDRNRVFACNAGSLEEMPDVPSVAQLRALWENQFPGIGRVNVMRYVDDDPPLLNEHPIFVGSFGSRENESYSDPGTSESPTQYYADEILTHADDDRSSSHVADTTVETNLEADYYRQECERLAELVDGQSEIASASKSQLEEPTALVNAQKSDLDRLKTTNEFNATLLESHQSQNER